jgi:drug/metabolite transporter (DMT)-like permease
MLELFLASLIWSISFGLIKGELTGLPATWVAMVRMGLALLVFLPFYRHHDVQRAFPNATKKGWLHLCLIGFVQFGVMYVLYIQSYQYLQAHEVALFTITTPLWVTLIYDGLSRRFHPWALAMVLLCLVGSLVIKYQAIARDDFWLGFGILQLANLCFAFGQVKYKKLIASPSISKLALFAPMFMGGLLATMVASAASLSSWSVTPTARQWWVLMYLGVLPTGAGFYLWNRGATKVKAGSLAIWNNMKIPMAILVSLLLFGEQANLPRLFIGLTLIVGALVAYERRNAS